LVRKTIHDIEYPVGNFEGDGTTPPLPEAELRGGICGCVPEAHPRSKRTRGYCPELGSVKRV
jgi:hypothetical protein